MAFKKCFVPDCPNTTYTCPDKKFVFVPKDEKTRSKWFQAAGRTKYLKTRCYCCDDHFDLYNDAENYTSYKYLDKPLELKKNVLPHRGITKIVCRICLRIIQDESQLVSLEYLEEDMKNMFEACLPEIDLSLTTSPVMCTKCHNTVMSFHELKLRALNYEMGIASLIKSKIKEAKLTDDDFKLNLSHDYKDLLKHNSPSCNTTNNLKIKLEDEEDPPRRKRLKKNQQKNEINDSINKTDDYNSGSGTSNNLINKSDDVSLQPKINETQYAVYESKDTAEVLATPPPEEVTRARISEDNNKEEKKIYNNEVSQVMYLNEDGTGSCTMVNVIQVIKKDNDGTQSSCLFCNDYVFEDVLNHSLTHRNTDIACSLCNFIATNATEDDISKHILVHSIVSNEMGEVK